MDKTESVYNTPSNNSVQGTAILGGSHVGKTMNLNGNITCDEDFTIQGKVTGDLKVGKTLVIGEQGEVDANMDAHTVIIIGNAKGNIKASHKVEIRSRGKFSGNIKSEVLVVEEGGILMADVNKETEAKS